MTSKTDKTRTDEQGVIFGTCRECGAEYLVGVAGPCECGAEHRPDDEEDHGPWCMCEECEAGGKGGYAVEDEDEGEDEAPDIWAMLERDAPAGCEAVKDLYSWSLNYDGGKGPFTLWLDLIGYSQDEFGAPMYDLADASLGGVELSKVAAALTEYLAAPRDVAAYVSELIEAEARA